jgi:hypothetical protein
VNVPEPRSGHLNVYFRLLCGVALCVWFYLIVIVQMVTRAGFDIRIHPLSLLSLGDEGFIQIFNFITTGALAICCATGMRKVMRGSRGGTWGPLLISTFGIGMVIAGIFPPDPFFGFPPGSSTAPPGQMSAHAVGHGVGFFVAFVSLISTCGVFARRYFSTGDRARAIYAIVTAVVTVATIALGMADQRTTGLAFFAVGIVAFGWLGFTAAQMRSELS